MCGCNSQPDVTMMAAASLSDPSLSPPAWNPIHSSLAYTGLFPSCFERGYCFYRSWICHTASRSTHGNIWATLHHRAWPTGTAGLQSIFHNLCFTVPQKSQLLYRVPGTHLPIAINVYSFINSSGEKEERIEHKTLSVAFYRCFTWWEVSTWGK